MQTQKQSESQQLTQKYMMNFIKPIPLTFVKGQGLRVWDVDGKEYLDFVGGWAVNSLGHCHPVVTRALAEQANQLIQISNAYYNIPQGKLAELLVKNSIFKQVFFANSGAEAVEGAIKLAKRYGHLKLNGAYEIITTHNSFHGRTLAATAATGQEKFQKPYLPLPAGFVNVEYNNLEAIKKATTARTCAVMLEPVQGEGGVNIPADDYLKQVRNWCDQKGILLILDEVQTGMGRLGKLFGYELFDVQPDVITLAKGLASGIPIGAILANEKAAVFAPGEHGSTFGGNPLCCAVGFAVTRYILDNDVPGNAKIMGDHILRRLEELKRKYPVIADVRGRGLLIAVEFKSEIAEKVMLECLARGFMINHLKANTLRVIPPLIITQSEADEGIDVLDKVLSNFKA